MFGRRDRGLHAEDAVMIPLRYDENTGEPVEPKRGRARRHKEYSIHESTGGVCQPVLKSDAHLSQAGKFIKTRWVEVNRSAVRSRFVARGFAHGDPREDLFAETPPLLAARMGLSLVASTLTSHVDP